MRKQILISVALILMAMSSVAHAQIADKKSLTLDGAKRVIAAAAAYAKKVGAPGGVIAVVDDGGNLIALERLDGTFTAGANISIGKAKTAVMFKRPTKFFEDVIKNGRTAMVALPDFTPLQGGIPIEYDGQIIGGVGVSGAASAQQDEELAIAGANVFKTGNTNSDDAHATGTKADAPTSKPEATINLATSEGVKSVKGEWRYSDTKIVEVDFRGPGADGQATGAPLKTYDYTPHAGGVDFDDAGWTVIDPATLKERRATGRLCFNWYRIKITIPERVGSFDPTGSTAVFETALDDYAEVWVDGELPRKLGQMGGSVVSGWNAPNRLVIGRDVKPGQQIQLAVFGINGPLSNPPTNFIWVREAKLDFYHGATGPISITPSEVNVEVVRNDPAMDSITGPNLKVFKLAEGFKFTEGPIWIRDGGYLLFNDPNSNITYKYKPNGNESGELSIFRTMSGYSGADIAEYGQPGANGMTLDPQGRLTVNQHGLRRVIRLEKDGTETVLADRYEDKRLNSPNDLVYRSDGTLYFTDPPFGLPKFFDDPRKELSFSGVYSVYKGKLQLISKDFTGPNGIAFSPDEKYLYVGDWDEKKVVVMRYEARADGTLANGQVFYDMTGALDKEKNAIDGIKVDRAGNLYVSGPGGLWVISPEGKHLGTIITPKHVHNMAWGDEDGRTLYLCARSGLYKMRLNIPGAGISSVAGK